MAEGFHSRTKSEKGESVQIEKGEYRENFDGNDGACIGAVTPSEIFL